MNEKQRRTRIGFMIAVSAVMLLLTPAALTSAASPPEPTYGSATVDGDYSEWCLAVGPSCPESDFFAELHVGWDPDKPLAGKLYLRYNCSTKTMYVLVLGARVFDPAGPVVLVDAAGADPSMAHIKIGGVGGNVVDGNSGNDGTPPDFAWINRRACDWGGCSGDIADGWEASFPLDPGTYELLAHTQVWDGSLSQTGGTGPDAQHRYIPLVIDCLTAVTLASATAASGGFVPAGWLVALAVPAMAVLGGGLWLARRRHP